MDVSQGKLGRGTSDVLAQTVLGRNNLANWVFEERRKESERRKDKDNWREATRQLMDARSY